MIEAQKPKWLEGWQPAPPRPKAPKRAGPGNPNWKRGGESPNPAGRPVGLPDRRLLATEQMLDELKAIVAVQVEKALDGDPGAASIVLARVLPALRPQAEKVSFEFDATAPISEQVAQVLAGIASGRVAPDVGRLIIESIKALADVRATEELEARIAALEEKEP